MQARKRLTTAVLWLGLVGQFACGGGSGATTSPGTTPATTAAPSAAFSFAPSAPTPSQVVQFTDGSTGSPTAWSWTFGDGGTSALQNPTHAFASAGTYAVTLTVSNAGGTNATTRQVTCRADASNAPQEAQIPAGEFAMGDHHGFVDPSHPSDELPIHTVRLSAFVMATAPTTNQEYLAFLNDALSSGLVQVRDGLVYRAGSQDVYAYTRQSASYSSLSYDGRTFTIADFRANHPVVGVMWLGAAAYANWLSTRNGLQSCYDLATSTCDFTKNGYRLPTEAEWEYAARGGQSSPYYNYPLGNDPDPSRANWPDSHDPYEGTDAASYPWTTPVRFYNGALRLKSEFNWPGSAASYQTANGANGFGLYDMAGNVWEFVNDWYGQDYYGRSPVDNPKGPDTGFVMPDGKPYRGMRGGNWYNGYVNAGVNDGHSRVSNRNPSYYRGPQDPNHPWYHVGFRVVRAAAGAAAPTPAFVAWSFVAPPAPGARRNPPGGVRE